MVLANLEPQPNFLEIAQSGELKNSSFSGVLAEFF